MEVKQLLEILKTILLTLGLEEIKLKSGTYKTERILQEIERHGNQDNELLQ